MVRNITILPPLLLATVMLGLALVVGLWPSGQAGASGHSATRSFDPSSVASGGEITVTIEASDYGSFGQVVETLPDGFSYMAGSTSPSTIKTAPSGQDVTFTFLGANMSFSYKVTASDTAGSHTFSGTVNDDTGDSRSISASDVTVTAAPGTTPPESSPTTPAPAQRGATRTISKTTVTPGEEVTVMIAAVVGSFGQVTETLPDGFSYVADSVSPSDIREAVDGQEVAFTLLGDTTFTYKVTASSTGGGHDFTGTLSDDEGNMHAVEGASSVTVDAPVPTATRSVSSSVGLGAELTVTIEAMDYGAFGQVVETLPSDFSYKTGSVKPSDIRVAMDGQELTFTLLRPTRFTYVVMAPISVGRYTFSGVLTNDQGDDTPIDDSTVSVEAPRGPRGPAGPSGRSGSTGAAGPQGPQGPAGPTAGPGPQGEQGDTGEPGAQGERGPQGLSGTTGAKGDTGTRGAQGEQGDTGEPGAQGERGPQGLSGTTGPKGDTGTRGAQGDTGSQGAQGKAGAQGDTGPQGVGSTQGERGMRGLQGDAGPQGVEGSSGGSALAIVAMIIAILALVGAAGGIFYAFARR